jgi:transposase
VIKLTYGHSKDHRPDLKQAVMSLVVSGKGAILIWMEPQDGVLYKCPANVSNAL